jgi:hypothetical protein
MNLAIGKQPNKRSIYLIINKSTIVFPYIILPWSSSSLSSKNPPSKLTPRSMALNSTDAFRGLSLKSSKSIRADRVFSECWFLHHVNLEGEHTNVGLDKVYKSTHFRIIMNSLKNWTQFRITSKMVSNKASLLSEAEHPVDITMRVTAHNMTRTVSITFQTDFQYAYKNNI